MSKIDTSNETRILLSFPMVSHGGNFAHWLRDRLMKHYGLYATNAVYCDCVSSRAGKALHVSKSGAHGIIGRSDADKALTSYDKDDPRERAVQLNFLQKFASKHLGYSVVSADTRQRFDRQGYAPIGAASAAWNQNFLAAMRSARAMVFVLTTDFAESPWCMKEWKQFHDENKRRGGAGKLRGVALNFLGQQNFAGADQTGIKMLPVTRQHGIGGLLWHKDDFGISETDFRHLVNAIGPLK